MSLCACSSELIISPGLSPLVTTDKYSFHYSFTFSKMSYERNQRVIFCVSLHLFNIKFLRLIHIAACINSLFFYCRVLVYCRMYYSSVIHSPKIWVVSSFYQFWMELLYTFTYRCLCRHMFSLILVKYPEETQNYFQSGCTIWCFPQQCVGVSLASHSCQYSFFFFLIHSSKCVSGFSLWF